MKVFRRTHGAHFSLDRFTLTARLYALSCAIFALVATLHAQSNYATPYTFTTLAGLAPNQGSTDGTGSAARFNLPGGVAADGAGNIYVADANNHTIRKITPAGFVSTFAGLAGAPQSSTDGTGSAARFYIPSGVAVDGSGNVYVADNLDHVIRKITPAAVVTTLAGLSGNPGTTDGTGSAARFNRPYHLAADAVGNVYVTENFDHTVRKITPAGVVTTLAGSAGVTGSTNGTGSAALFNKPSGIAVDGSGNVYVADTNNHVIRKISPAGEVTTFAGLAGSAGTTDGTGSAARFIDARGLAVDGVGNVYVVDFFAQTIRRITAGGVVTTLAGSATSGSNDGDGSTAQFFKPVGIAVDGSGNLYVADSNNHTIRGGILSSSEPTITVPTISIQPVSVSVLAGDQAILEVTATGTEPISYLWYKDGIALPWAQAAQLVIPHATLDDGGEYTVEVFNSAGTVTSAAATVTVDTFPVVTITDSTRRVLSPGQSLNLGVSVNGQGSISYQWIHNGRPVAGATQANLSISTTTVQDGGWYAVDVADDSNHKRSVPMFVTIAPSISQIRVWGANGNGQLNVPNGITNAVAISAGGSHTLALRSDGTVVAWGYDGSGEVTIPENLTDVVAVSAGNSYSLALKSDGRVVAWGWNGYGQTTVPNGLSGVVAISAGAGHSLALKSDGTVVAWGYNSEGQATVPANLTGVVAISAGGSHSLALKNDGTVVAWGWNSSGQTAVPIGLSGVMAVSAGGGHSLALKGDGTVVAWGWNSYGQTVIPLGLSGVTAISAGNTHSLAIKGDGTVTAWGSASGDVDSGQSHVPVDLADVIGIGGGMIHSVALRNATLDTTPVITVQPVAQQRTEGQSVTISVTASGPGPLTYQWRKNGGNIGGATLSSLTFDSILPLDAAGYDVVVGNQAGSVTSSAVLLTVKALPVISDQSPPSQVLAPGQNLSLSVTATGTGPLNYQWTRNGRPISAASAATSVLSLSNLTLSDSGYYLALITDNNGTRYSAPIFVTVMPPQTKITGWGANSSGEATPPVGLNNAIAIEAGASHAVALRSDGTVVAWGANYSGSPATVPAGLAQVVAISSGGWHVLAVKSDATVVAWGENYQGKSSVPAGLSDVVQVSAGGDHSLALKSNGTVVAWGYNLAGQCTVPVGLSGVVAIAAGGNHSLALKNDGTVMAWGYNLFGQATVPSGLANVVAIAAGYDFSLALKSDGTLVAWGSNDSSQINLPQGLNSVTAISAGGMYSLALRLNRTVVAWGYNTTGLLAVPVNLTNVLAVAAGGNFSLALRDDTAPVFTIQPLSLAATTGQSAAFNVTATGSPTYQWKKDGTVISGATNSFYSIGSVGQGDAGGYTVVATNAVGSVTSNVAMLQVIPAGFDVAAYLARYPEVAALFNSDPYGAWLYYHDHGIYQGEVFDDLFRVDEYLVLYPNLFELFGNDLGAALDHWLSTGRIEGKLGRIPLEFNATGYFTRNPDVATAVNNDPLLAWGHYWLYGIYEGRAYDEELRVFEYLAINADLTAAFVNDWRQAALHWMRYGRTEGRLGRLALSFNVTEYLNRNPDVLAVYGTNPTTVFLHYWAYGIDEGRTYDDLFRPDEYLVLNPDLASALGTDRRLAFKHWVRYGQAEGRPGKNP